MSAENDPAPLFLVPDATEDHGLLGSAIHLAVGTAWWLTGPVRLGGRLAARTAEAVLSDARQRSGWLQGMT